MTIAIPPDLEAALKAHATKEGITPDEAALETLPAKFLAPLQIPEPRDDWERRVLSLGSDCGISLPNWAVGSEGLYE